MKQQALPWPDQDRSAPYERQHTSLAAYSASRSVLGRSMAMALAALVLGLLLTTRNSSASRYMMAFPFALALTATWDTARSMRVTWDLHHGGVVLLLYADMMLLTLIAVWTIWPA